MSNVFDMHSSSVATYIAKRLKTKKNKRVLNNYIPSVSQATIPTMKYTDSQPLVGLLPEATAHMQWDDILTSDAPRSNPTLKINYLLTDYSLNS